MYLVDTNVLSAGASSGAVLALTEWMDRNSTYLYLSVVTVAEVESGVAKARRTGASSKARRLAAWLSVAGNRAASLSQPRTAA